MSTNEKFPGIPRLISWAIEREKIRIKKERGDPPPWTDDEILQKGHFCNVRREDDPVTRWIAEHWRKPHADDPFVFFAMCVARLVNWPDTLQEAGYPSPWSREYFVTALKAREERGEQVWTNAYMIHAGDVKGVSKIEHIADILDRLWAGRERLRPRPGGTLHEFYDRLLAIEGLGTFYAAQIVADAKHVDKHLLNAPDWMTFVAPGPGSKRGLNYVLGRPRDQKWDDNSWKCEFLALRRKIENDPELADDRKRVRFDELSNQDLQNCLCEASKYFGALRGERKLKRTYKPQGATKPVRRAKAMTTSTRSRFCSGCAPTGCGH